MANPIFYLNLYANFPLAHPEHDGRLCAGVEAAVLLLLAGAGRAAGVGGRAGHGRAGVVACKEKALLFYLERFLLEANILA